MLVIRGPTQGSYYLSAANLWTREVRTRAGRILVTQFEGWQTLKINTEAVTVREVGELKNMARNCGSRRLRPIGL